jgi:predicted transcriptional regulator
MPDEGVKATAWNNRLRDLYEKRLLTRKKTGREQVYSPVVEEVNSNG